MDVIIRATQERVKEVVEHDLYWYDHVTGDTLHGRGSNITLVYSRELKRNIPIVEKNPQWVTKSNFERISEWANKYKNVYGFEIEYTVPNHYLIIDIPEHLYETISRHLQAEKISHDEY